MFILEFEKQRFHVLFKYKLLRSQICAWTNLCLQVEQKKVPTSCLLFIEQGTCLRALVSDRDSNGSSQQDHVQGIDKVFLEMVDDWKLRG